MLDPKAILSELNLEESELPTITTLTKQAEAIVVDSLDSKNTTAWENNEIFVRAVISLTTALYYDRLLSNGVPAGVKMMLIHLKGTRENNDSN